MKILSASKGVLETLISENHSDTYQILQSLNFKLSPGDYITIDVEHDQDYTNAWVGIQFQSKVVLFPIARKGNTSFDATNKTQLSNLLNTLHIIKIFHDFSADSITLYKVGVETPILNVVDTKSLACICKLPQSLDELAIHLKVGSKINNGSNYDIWSRDNIPDDAAIYCSNDIQITSKILLRMLGRLERDDEQGEDKLSLNDTLIQSTEHFINSKKAEQIAPTTKEKWISLFMNGISIIKKNYPGNDGHIIADKLYEHFKNKCEPISFTPPMFSSTSPPKKLNLDDIDERIQPIITERVKKLEEKVDQFELSNSFLKNRLDLDLAKFEELTEDTASRIDVVEKLVDKLKNDILLNDNQDKVTNKQLQDTINDMKGLRLTMFNELEHITNTVKPVITDILNTFQDHIDSVPANTGINDEKEEEKDPADGMDNPVTEGVYRNALAYSSKQDQSNAQDQTVGSETTNSKRYEQSDVVQDQVVGSETVDSKKEEQSNILNETTESETANTMNNKTANPQTSNRILSDDIEMIWH